MKRISTRIKAVIIIAVIAGLLALIVATIPLFTTTKPEPKPKPQTQPPASLPIPKQSKQPSKQPSKPKSVEPPEQKIELVKAKRGGTELVFIPGGVFRMGSPESEEGRADNEGPVHKVEIPDFYLGRYPVTNQEYSKFLSAKPGREKPQYWQDSKYNQPRQPVVGVTWHDAKAYAIWAGGRLPSEAEWEYACRAGTTTRYYKGNSTSDLEKAAWHQFNSDNRLQPVGKKEPNAFGLYDMHGGVWEWIEDDYHLSYDKPPSDGKAWVDEPRVQYRVLRGGSWQDEPKFCRSACRIWYTPVSSGMITGFRMAMDSVPER